MTTSDELAALAQQGVKTIETTILGLLESHPEGLRNSQIASMLGLRSSFRGRQRDYLSYSVLGGLLAQGKVIWDQTTKLFTVVSLDESAPLAQEGVERIEKAILQLLRANPAGLRNAEIAESLGLRSSFRGRQKDYLTYSVLGRMLARGQVVWDEDTKLFTKP